MARFRAVFWLVVFLGALPSLVSGIWLIGQFRIESLCGARPSGAAPAALTWIRLHEWGAVGALLVALLVIGYALARSLQRRRRRALMIALGGWLGVAFGVAVWSGRVTPWRALAASSLAAPSIDARADEESGGGPEYCLQHLEEVHHLRLVYWLHAGSGGLALLLTLALTDAGARWKATSAR